MNRRMHLVLRGLALVPAIAAIAFALSQSDHADAAPAGNVRPTAAADTVAAMLPAPSIATIPTLFAIQSADTPSIDDDSVQLELIGIAGRLPDDVEVLLRMPEGQTRSVRIGESVDDWRLVSAAADRAVFSDNGKQVVLTLGPLP